MTVLGTKVHVPVPRRELVARPRLTQPLTDLGAVAPRLVLVSAPAGAGKPTLLSQWLTTGLAPGSHVAWLSLDEADNDLRRFLSHLLAALRVGVSAGFGDLTPLLESGGEVPTDALLTRLVNDLDGVEAAT